PHVERPAPHERDEPHDRESREEGPRRAPEPCRVECLRVARAARGGKGSDREDVDRGSEHSAWRRHPSCAHRADPTTEITASWSAPLVASELPFQALSLPSISVNLPPASRTIGTSAARSYGFTSNSATMSTSPSASSMYDHMSP